MTVTQIFFNLIDFMNKRVNNLEDIRKDILTTVEEYTARKDELLALTNKIEELARQANKDGNL